MWNWFGGAAAQKKKDAPKQAILDLRTQLDMLQKREKHIENLIQEQEKIARANITKNKNAARTAIKRKKQHEATLEQTSNQIAVLENQVYTIEAANINHETLQAMKNAGQAMKTIHAGTSIEVVDDIMEKLSEQKQLADEISAAITYGPGAADPMDEDELEKELEQLEQEKLDDDLLKTGTVPVLPTGPTTEPASKGKERAKEEDEEEEELARLQREMAM